MKYSSHMDVVRALHRANPEAGTRFDKFDRDVQPTIYVDEIKVVPEGMFVTDDRKRLVAQDKNRGSTGFVFWLSPLRYAPATATASGQPRPREDDGGFMAALHARAATATGS